MAKIPGKKCRVQGRPLPTRVPASYTGHLNANTINCF